MDFQSDQPIGLVKGPGEGPHEYVFVTADHRWTRVGEFVRYEVRYGSETLTIFGHVVGRELIRNLPESFLVDPRTSPVTVSSLIGLEEGSECELFEVTFEAIGYFNPEIGDFINPRIPPTPGDPIYLASSETLAEIVSPHRPGDTGSAHIGSLLTREKDEVPVVLSVKELVATHLAVIASTGSGKSYTAGVLVEELMMPYNRAAVLIIDPHGEYHTLQAIASDERFRGPDGYMPEVRIYTHDRIRVRFSTLTEADIKYLLPEGASEKMLHYLSQAYRALAYARERRLWGYQDLCDEITKLKYDHGDSSNASSIDGLLWRLAARFDKPGGIFSDSEHLSLQELFRPGRCTVLQLSDIEQSEQQVIVATLLRRVNKARKMTTRGEVDERDENYLPYPVFTLLEEAHRFAPAGQTVVSTNILKEILGEGRKFGVGIGLITQRPGKLDQDVLSQCMTQIIMRIVNPFDQDNVARSVESTGRALLAELPALTKGQAVISGSAINIPVTCQVRERLTRHGGQTLDAPADWQNYFTPREQRTAAERRAVLVKLAAARKPDSVDGIDV
ncbi:MAG: ATP-binding protein [Pyrinomonas sp.]